MCAKCYHVWPAHGNHGLCGAEGISFFLPNATVSLQWTLVCAFRCTQCKALAFVLKTLFCKPQWLQPPGYVHQMIDKTWQVSHGLQLQFPMDIPYCSCKLTRVRPTRQPNALNISATAASGDVGNTMASAQKSADGKTLVVRFVNFASASAPTAPAKVTVRLKSRTGAPVETAGSAVGETVIWLTSPPHSY